MASFEGWQDHLPDDRRTLVLYLLLLEYVSEDPSRTEYVGAYERDRYERARKALDPCPPFPSRRSEFRCREGRL